MRVKKIIVEGEVAFGIRYDFSTHELLIGGPARFQQAMEDKLRFLGILGVEWERKASRIRGLVEDVSLTEEEWDQIEGRSVSSFRRMMV